MTTAAPDSTDVAGYEVVVGLEVHAQLRTRSKMFCHCASDYFAAAPNTRVCAVCLGMPGVLPVINRAAVDCTILTGLALGSEIPEHTKFDRKNYPYPDLMKGYQISQYDQPLCVGGTVHIEADGAEHTVRLERIHLEEDTARLLHREDDGGYSLLDVNRSGVPLMEIVSAPDIRSATQAVAYLRKLRQTLRYLEVSDADMEKGSFRCDANISLRKPGDPLGSKVEIKNMNSFRAVQRAIEFEAVRQAAILDAGGSIEQETRGYVDATGQTASQRSKEEAHDYRYFPEPDLPPLSITSDRTAALRERLPELPDARRARFEAEYGLSSDEARILVETRARADAYETAVALAGDDDAQRAARARAVALWLIGDVAALLNDLGGDAELSDTKLTPGHVAALVRLADAGTITAATAKEVLAAAFESGDMPDAIVEARGLGQVRDDAEIARIAEAVIEANPKPVADYRGGKDSAIKFLVGQVMRETRGRADPNEAQAALRAALDA
ncbi:MAG: Asp-tRNA(Asn)/Glu-tRNA(Gln) amidotransferase subunit GatB [Chloroflexi bacterium]|nr:Asp-tRNA(Asn)/Glu-tRNA(Gln) amidotransferase subunit GatB [Chloroflexota bacterium]